MSKPVSTYVDESNVDECLDHASRCIDGDIYDRAPDGVERAVSSVREPVWARCEGVCTLIVTPLDSTVCNSRHIGKCIPDNLNAATPNGITWRRVRGGVDRLDDRCSVATDMHATDRAVCCERGHGAGTDDQCAELDVGA
jgi:hypothetical protein